MALHAILGMLVDGYTTDQLEAHINQMSWGHRKFLLGENIEGLFWMGKRVPVRRIPVYLAADDSRRKAPAMWSEGCDDFGREPGAKQVWLPHYCLYRCPQTEGKWFSPCVYEYVTLCDNAGWVELLYLDDEHAYMERYELTEDPLAEDPAEQEFEYYAHLGVLTITGVRHYCERLHIPAQLDGIPVAKVCLSNSLKLCYLREVVVEEGVQKLDFFFGFPELATIDLPHSVTLVRAPDEIRYSRWFQNQPDGPVYFQNYYCGTKGTSKQDVLTLREGTVGVIEWADIRQQWRQITLPSTLTYIASGAFDTGRHLQKVNFSEGTEQLKGFFSWLHPFYGNVRRRGSKLKPLPGVEPMTGKDLYDLGRDHIAVQNQIPWEWLPSVPRLRYVDGWIAEYWYCAEYNYNVGYYLSLRVPSGELVEMKKLDKNAHASFVGCWTDAYLPPEYLISEDYLDCCAVILRSGEPTKEILEQLNSWWERLVSRKVLEAARSDEKQTHMGDFFE